MEGPVRWISFVDRWLSVDEAARLRNWFAACLMEQHPGYGAVFVGDPFGAPEVAVWALRSMLEAVLGEESVFRPLTKFLCGASLLRGSNAPRVVVLEPWRRLGSQQHRVVAALCDGSPLPASSLREGQEQPHGMRLVALCKPGASVPPKAFRGHRVVVIRFRDDGGLAWDEEQWLRHTTRDQALGLASWAQASGNLDVSWLQPNHNAERGK